MFGVLLSQTHDAVICLSCGCRIALHHPIKICTLLKFYCLTSLFGTPNLYQKFCNILFANFLKSQQGVPGGIEHMVLVTLPTALTVDPHPHVQWCEETMRLRSKCICNEIKSKI